MNTEARIITKKLVILKCVLWFLLGIGAAAGAARFLSGLGATTALSDKTPWGFWIGFDVLAGVALAAGGFIIAGTVYIGHMERYRPLVRPAILTAFLGYAAVASALAFDVGLPWNLWRPLLYPQFHSALFEVAMCVMLYLTVLALEFSPVVLERLPFRRLLALMQHLVLPLVIAGIILSTLHQSSLGTLFVIMPSRLHPLWYTSLLPLLFLISAVGLGLAVVIMESLVTSWLYDREPEEELLAGLAKASVYVLSLYAVLRIGDVAIHGKLHHVTKGTWESALFIFEMLLSAVVPVALFSFPAIRKNRTVLWLGAGAVVLGFVLNRLSVAWFSTIPATGATYFPSWMELAITLGIISGAGLVFFFLKENFSVYKEAVGQKDSLPAAGTEVGNDFSFDVLWGNGYRQYSLIFAFGAATAFGFLPDDAIRGAQPTQCVVQKPRRMLAEKLLGADGKVCGLAQSKSSAGESVEVFTIDGNRNGRLVLFDHDAHSERNGGKASCVLCHHMNMPKDRETSCWECHRDMYQQMDIFDHEYHIAQHHGNSGCVECHKDLAALKSRETAVPCADCHKEMLVPGSRLKVPATDSRQYLAVGYMEAMHNLCLPCHREKHPDIDGVPDLHTRCGFCHRENAPVAAK